MKENMMQKVRAILRVLVGRDEAEQIEESKRRIDAAERKLRSSPREKVRRALQSVGALAILVALGACKCPPGTGANLANVEAIVAENDAARASSSDPDSVKQTKALRNREALDLARKMVEACR